MNREALTAELAALESRVQVVKTLLEGLGYDWRKSSGAEVVAATVAEPANDYGRYPVLSPREAKPQFPSSHAAMQESYEAYLNRAACEAAAQREASACDPSCDLCSVESQLEAALANVRGAPWKVEHLMDVPGEVQR